MEQRRGLLVMVDGRGAQDPCQKGVPHWEGTDGEERKREGASSFGVLILRSYRRRKRGKSGNFQAYKGD
ncbi:hypothetical protein QJS10_CPB15g01165 [Acorus calamus]|uniref:Uncharacterized protein n=1 Tax=Acorus calamus TaxID=4465 RepID=A0AAV9D2P4_ACOCL|nr:hypothetical protein QJS10_CPB15g01165 [Acorus calamus]